MTREEARNLWMYELPMLKAEGAVDRILRIEQDARVLAWREACEACAKACAEREQHWYGLYKGTTPGADELWADTHTKGMSDGAGACQIVCEALANRGPEE